MASKNIVEKAPLILNTIKASNNILLHCHPSADGDSIGSTLAMREYIQSLGKKVTLIQGDSEYPEYMKTLPGSKDIEKKSYLDINPNEYDLFIIIDSSNIKQISKLGEVVIPDSMKTIVIDHHRSNEEYGDINLVETNYIAATEIVYDLLRIWKADITHDMAINLMVGIYTDSGGFKYPPTSANTLLAASYLAQLAPDYTTYIFDLENSYSEKQIEYVGLALSNLEKYYHDNLVISAIPYEELEKRGIKKEDTHKMEISNMIKSVIGWNIAATLVETEKDKVGVSLRTRDSEKYDLSILATSLGGGGHKTAAGATIYASFEEAKKILLKKVKEIYLYIEN